MKALLICIAFLAAGMFPLPSLGGEASTFERLKTAPDLMWDNCTECHELDWPMDKTADREEWVDTLKRMEVSGAVLDQPDKEVILDFLVAKSVFDAKCTSCHDRDRSLSLKKTFEKWGETVKEMAGKVKEPLTDQEIDAISAFLAIEAGKE